MFNGRTTSTRRGDTRGLQDEKLDEGDTDNHNDGYELREATPRIYKEIRKLQNATLRRRTTTVHQMLEVWPGPSGPMSRLADTAPEDTHPPSARTTKLSH